MAVKTLVFCFGILISSLATAQSDVQLAQIEVRPRPFLCLINYHGLRDRCDVNRPVSGANEWCQCSYNGEPVDGVVILNPSYQWSR